MLKCIYGNFSLHYFRFLGVTMGTIAGSMTAGITYNWLEHLYVRHIVYDKKSYYSFKGYPHRHIIPLLMCATGAFTGGYLTYKKLK